MATTIIKAYSSKPSRRKSRETTIVSTVAASVSSTAPDASLAHHGSRNPDAPTIVSPDPWCCPVLPSALLNCRRSPTVQVKALETMVSNGNHCPPDSSISSNFSKFNSVLTAGLLNPTSPPPEKVRSSPTLFEIMSCEPETQQRSPIPAGTGVATSKNHQVPVQTKQTLIVQRLMSVLGNRSPGNRFNDPFCSDVELKVSAKDGVSVSMHLHREILVAHSRFFAMRLSDRYVKQQKSTVPYTVEIVDCDDVEIYVETLRLMYSNDLKRRLMKEDVGRIISILKVSAEVGFDDAIFSCLEYLEAAPWAEEEEEKIVLLLSELKLEGAGAGDALKRVSVEVASQTEAINDTEEVMLKLLRLVLEGKDEKSRRQMKSLLSKMLHESYCPSSSSSPHSAGIRRETLYSACDGCLNLLRQHFLDSARHGLENVEQISRQADNLDWVLDLLIDANIAEEFLGTWASQCDLSEAHSSIPAVHRHEISRVTARLFVGIGKRQVLTCTDDRLLLLKTWLVPFYDDFGWMRRSGKGLDRHLIEDGLCNTILTLPLPSQQEIFLAWLQRFMNCSFDCPNIQRGFEVWWRRAFLRRKIEPLQQHTQKNPDDP